MAADDHILIMDADSTLNDTIVENAYAALAKDQAVGAISSTPSGKPGKGYLLLMQQMEYEQYSHEMLLKKEALALPGAGTVFRVGVLKQVAAARGDQLPGETGRVFNVASITEDNELTLAIKTVGWKCTQT